MLSINSLHFKRKVKKLNVKTSLASICHFQFYNMDTKNSILISSLIGNPCNPKQHYKPEGALAQTITFGEIVCTILTNKYINTIIHI